MSQINYTLYRQIADSYAIIWTYIDGVNGESRNAVDAIVDVTTTGYSSDDGTGSADSDAALEIELALLAIFNNAYTASGGISTSTFLTAVRTVNNFVVTNYSGSQTTATTKMRDFVNNTMFSTWTGNCVPLGWTEICDDAGFDTGLWNSCS